MVEVVSSLTNHVSACFSPCSDGHSPPATAPCSPHTVRNHTIYYLHVAHRHGGQDGNIPWQPPGRCARESGNMGGALFCHCRTYARRYVISVRSAARRRLHDSWTFMSYLLVAREVGKRVVHHLTYSRSEQTENACPAVAAAKFNFPMTPCDSAARREEHATHAHGTHSHVFHVSRFMLTRQTSLCTNRCVNVRVGPCRWIPSTLPGMVTSSTAGEPPIASATWRWSPTL